MEIRVSPCADCPTKCPNLMCARFRQCFAEDWDYMCAEIAARCGRDIFEMRERGKRAHRYYLDSLREEREARSHR